MEFSSTYIDLYAPCAFRSQKMVSCPLKLEFKWLWTMWMLGKAASVVISWASSSPTDVPLKGFVEKALYNFSVTQTSHPSVKIWIQFEAFSYALSECLKRSTTLTQERNMTYNKEAYIYLRIESHDLWRTLSTTRGYLRGDKIGTSKTVKECILSISPRN